MATSQEIKQVWSSAETALGYAAGLPIAQELAGHQYVLQQEVEEAARFIDHYPMKSFVYEGAEETVRTLVDRGSRVKFWTQGEPRHQLYKVASSGLLKMRHEDPEIKARVSAYANLDKVGMLPQLIPQVVEQNVNRVVIVDDKSNNILRIHLTLAQMRESGILDENVQVDCVWMNQGRTKDQVPEGYDLDEFKRTYQTIEDIRQLPSLTEDDNPERTVYFLDWDHTLADTGKWRTAAQGELARISDHESITSGSRFKDHAAGLVGSEVVESYSCGMSGSRVARVKNEQVHEVIKYAPPKGGKIARELSGYAHIRNSPLAPYLVEVDGTHSHHGVLRIAHAEGVQLREALKHGLLTDSQIMGVFAELRALKREWWGSQERLEFTPENSMLRMEWDETIRLFHESILPALASGGQDISQPLQIQGDDGWEVEADVCQMVAEIDQFVTHRAPDAYAVCAHNDATGGNIVVDPATNTWKLFDYEWAGPNDPAESYARMIKAYTTSSLRGLSMTQTSKGLYVMHHEDASLAQKLQYDGEQYAPTMGETLKDSSFPLRVQWYLAGSYLREAALADRRGGLPAALFGFSMAARSLRAAKKQ